MPSLSAARGFTRRQELVPDGIDALPAASDPRSAGLSAMPGIARGGTGSSPALGGLGGLAMLGWYAWDPLH